MFYTQLVIKTNKEARKFDSINATLLQQAGFIDQTMAGVYTFLPLGLRALNKIEGIIREEMDKIGVEMLMPALAPNILWEATGRKESVDVLFEARGGNEKSRAINDASYVLNSTHEEVVTPIIKKFRPSYKDLPCAVYQIQTKFRNEPRPKSGLLRGREFRMKDLYSFHKSEEEFREFYSQIKDVYTTIFHRLGIGDDTHFVYASGGSFTKEYSHEFDTECKTGEDEIYYNSDDGNYYNRGVASKELKDNQVAIRVSEVGNIFPLGTKFSESFGYKIVNELGEVKPVYMGSYGIGSSRVMGVLVEKFNDERGIIWPDSVAPFKVHLLPLESGNKGVRIWANKVYDWLIEKGVEVLYDDRPEVSAGERFADADLIGIPLRVLISEKTKERVEVKRRGDTKEKIMSVKSLLAEV